MDPRWWRLEPVLASTGQPPADQRGWATEYKWDGQRSRALIHRDGRVELLSRNNNVITASFPELSRLGELLSGREGVLDGEIVASRSGRPDFAQLQKRMHLQRPSPRTLEAVSISYMVFDLLDLDGDDLTRVDYRTRRSVLASLSLSSGAPVVQVPPHYEDLAVDKMLIIAAEHGLEGVIVKHLTSTYRPGRSKSWIKVPFTRTTEAVIGGWQPGRGQLAGTVGALLLGAHTTDGRLAYLGHVSSGLTHAQRRVLADGLPDLEIRQCPFTPPPPAEHTRSARWVDPLVVVDVAYREITRDGRLRAPSWRGIRSDIEPEQVVVPNQ